MLELNNELFPLLQTERLVLRELREADVDEIFFLRSDAQVLKYLDRKPAASKEEAFNWIRLVNTAQKENNSLQWAICLKDNPQLIGTFCFWNVQKEHYRAEIGYSLHPQWQGKGIMSEAMKIALDYGFKEIKFHYLEANVNPNNTASINVLQRHKFVKEAHFRENYYYEGKFLDSAIYSLLASVHLK
mgnify:CR=1 FL=1